VTSLYAEELPRYLVTVGRCDDDDDDMTTTTARWWADTLSEGLMTMMTRWSAASPLECLMMVGNVINGHPQKVWLHRKHESNPTVLCSRSLLATPLKVRNFDIVSVLALVITVEDNWQIFCLVSDCISHTFSFHEVFQSPSDILHTVSSKVYHLARKYLIENRANL